MHPCSTSCTAKGTAAMLKWKIRSSLGVVISTATQCTDQQSSHIHQTLSPVLPPGVALGEHCISCGVKSMWPLVGQLHCPCLAIVCKISSIKPEIRNVLECHQRTELKAACTEKLVKFRLVVFEIPVDRLSDRHAPHNTPPPTCGVINILHIISG